MKAVGLIGLGLLGIVVIGVVLFGWIDGWCERWQRKRLAGVRLVPWLHMDGTLVRMPKR